MKRLSTLVMAISLMFLSGAASAMSIAVTDVTGAGVLGEGANGSTRGYAFTASQNILVDHLGVWDNESDGLFNDHLVGIWDSGMSLLTSTTVQSGTASAVMGGVVLGGEFRYEAIAPLLLLANTEYFIGAQFFDPFDIDGPADRFLNFGTGATTDPVITITDFRRAHFNSFDFPELSFEGSTGYFGPNFKFTVQQVSEPGTLAILGLGLAGLGFARRRKAA